MRSTVRLVSILRDYAKASCTKSYAPVYAVYKAEPYCLEYAYTAFQGELQPAIAGVRL
jgi:hypothetical protein